MVHLPTITKISTELRQIWVSGYVADIEEPDTDVKSTTGDIKEPPM